jgi:hypothetical protein
LWLALSGGCLIRGKHRSAVRAILRFYPHLACFWVNRKDKIDGFLHVTVAHRL